MLQILTGKFYGTILSYDIYDKDIFYSNISINKTVETPIGTLEYIKGNDINAYVFHMNGLIYKTNRRFNFPEALNQFRLLCSFGFKTIFNADKNKVKWLCRESADSSEEIIVPSKVVSDFFDKSFKSKEDVKNFTEFIQKVFKLPRVKYKAVINSINAFIQALNVLSYDFELAFSLMIYSLESLSQNFDEFEPKWQDYDLNTRNQLDNFFEEFNIEKEIVGKIHSILLNNSHLKLSSRFLNFCEYYVNDSFFKENSSNSKIPLKKSELRMALNNAYKLRSEYAHSLKRFNSSLEYFYSNTEYEALHFDNNVYLTFNGLTKLTHHIITNFIMSSESIDFEDYNWFEDLPEIAILPKHPKFWISNAEAFNSKEIYVWFSNFLLIYKESFNNNIFCDLRNLMFKIEDLIKKGVKKEFKHALISFYYLYNSMVPKEYQTEDYINFIKKYNLTNSLNNLTIENLVSCLILDKEISWNIEDIMKLYEWYLDKKFSRKNLVKLPTFLEVNILIYISNTFLDLKNYKMFKYWLNKAIFELSGCLNSQNFLENHIDACSKIDLDKFNNLLLCGDLNV